MATIYAYIDQDSRKIIRDDVVVGVKSDIGVDVITFVFKSTFDAVNLTTAAKSVFYLDKSGELKEQLLTTMTENDLGDYEIPWPLPSSLLEDPIRVKYGLSLTETGSNSKVTKRWVTADAVYKIQDSIYGDGAEEPIDEDKYDELAALMNKVLAAANKIDETGEIIANISGSAPTFVDTLADRTDTKKIYVVKADGNLYYYSGSEWVNAGKYGSYELDTGLDKSGRAADSGAVGAALATKVDVSQGATKANMVLATDDNGDVVAEDVSVVLGTNGATFLKSDLYGLPVFRSDTAVADTDTANMVGYIIERLKNGGDEFYTDATTGVTYGEHGGHGMITVNGVFAFCIVNSAFVAYAKSGSTWNTTNAATYFQNNPFTIYATVKI